MPYEIKKSGDDFRLYLDGKDIGRADPVEVQFWKERNALKEENPFVLAADLKPGYWWCYHGENDDSPSIIKIEAAEDDLFSVYEFGNPDYENITWYKENPDWRFKAVK